MVPIMENDFFSNLAPISCHSASDALLCLPRMHIDKTEAHAHMDYAPLERPALFDAKLLSFRSLNADGIITTSLFPRSIELMLEFRCGATVKSRMFGIRQAEIQPLVGTRVVLEGEARKFQHGYSLYGASFSSVSGNIEPKYVGVSGSISGEKIQAAVRKALEIPGALDAAVEKIEANFPIQSMLLDNGLEAKDLLLNLHNPKNLMEADRALQLARACAVHEIRYFAAANTSNPEPVRYNIDEAIIRLVKAQKETLSPDQRRALNEIRLEVNAKRGSRVLLNGDVGTGKTLVFLLAIAAIASTSGKKVAVVVPSDLVARQIHAQATARFPELRPELVIAGSQPSAANSLMLIGTQALFNYAENMEFEALVVDEQHKFSVAQRGFLASNSTHVIEASATPIPRSLAIAIFDGWKQVRIVNGPTAKFIKSKVVMDTERKSVSCLIRSHLENGKKVIFLYPKVNGEGQSVRAAGERLGEHFPGKVAVLHGQMTGDKKAAALKEFADGKCPIIVASTAVEVGVDVPDIGLMVVSGADRFGVAQLHQLRGRLARNGGNADFVMMLDKKPTKTTLQRLQALCDHSDGFSLAERDMEIRGFGEILGEFQSGKSIGTFKLTNLDVADFTEKNTTLSIFA